MMKPSLPAADVGDSDAGLQLRRQPRQRVQALDQEVAHPHAQRPAQRSVCVCVSLASVQSEFYVSYLAPARHCASFDC